MREVLLYFGKFGAFDGNKLFDTSFTCNLFLEVK
jgi:hypothetical protein